jgi:hypothetical protein
MREQVSRRTVSPNLGCRCYTHLQQPQQASPMAVTCCAARTCQLPSLPISPLRAAMCSHHTMPEWSGSRCACFCGLYFQLPREFPGILPRSPKAIFNQTQCLTPSDPPASSIKIRPWSRCMALENEREYPHASIFSPEDTSKRQT